MYYCYVLRKLKADICCKWSDLRSEQIFFTHDNRYPSIFSWVHNSIPRWAWLIYFSTGGLFAWSGTQWFLVIPTPQRFPEWPALCKWYTDETSTWKIFLRLSDELLWYRNWTYCRSKCLKILMVIMLQNRLSRVAFVVCFQRNWCTWPRVMRCGSILLKWPLYYS